MKLLGKQDLVKIVTVFLSFIFISAVSHNVDARSLSEIYQTKEIRLCLAGSSRAFYKTNALAFVDYLNKNNTGSDVRAKIVEFEKWNDQFVDGNGDVRKEAAYTPAPLANAECDLYPNDLVKLDWRQSKLAYVDFFVSRSAVITHASTQSHFENVTDLAGKTLAVMQGTSYHSVAEELNRTTLSTNPVRITFLPQKEALNAVSQKKFDFAITGADGAFWAIQNGIKDIAVAFPVGEKRSIYGWCMRYEDVELQKAVGQFFADQRSRPESEVNRNWVKVIGISLHDFDLYVNSSP